MRSAFVADTVDVALRQAAIQRIVHDFHLSTVMEYASGARRTESLLPRAYDLGTLLTAFTRYYLNRPPNADCAITEGNVKACKKFVIIHDTERVDCETLSVRSSTLYNHLLSQDESAYGFKVERIRGGIGTGVNTATDIQKKGAYRRRHSICACRFGGGRQLQRSPRASIRRDARALFSVQIARLCACLCQRLSSCVVR